MNFLSGWKTYASGIGLMLVGLGGLLTQKLGFVEGLTEICSGLAIVGARAVATKIMALLASFKK